MREICQNKSVNLKINIISAFQVTVHALIFKNVKNVFAFLMVSTFSVSCGNEFLRTYFGKYVQKGVKLSVTLLN